MLSSIRAVPSVPAFDYLSCVDYVGVPLIWGVCWCLRMVRNTAAVMASMGDTVAMVQIGG